jgi:hypothetical protein
MRMEASKITLKFVKRCPAGAWPDAGPLPDSSGGGRNIGHSIVIIGTII